VGPHRFWPHMSVAYPLAHFVGRCWVSQWQEDRIRPEAHTTAWPLSESGPGRCAPSRHAWWVAPPLERVRTWGATKRNDTHTHA
jgi:hypothetical protein